VHRDVVSGDDDLFKLNPDIRHGGEEIPRRECRTLRSLRPGLPASAFAELA